MSPGPQWLTSAQGLLGTHLRNYAQATLALLIDYRWSNITLNLILNESDESRRNKLMDAWLSHRLADLDRINITAVLIGGVISSAFSWYNIAGSPWSTKALWYCGLLFAGVAITTAGVHSAGLHRLGCHPEWRAKLQTILGVPVHSGRWRPRVLQPVMWQTPGLMLKLATFCFLLGLLILVCDAANGADLWWGSDDTKIATLFTAAAGVSFILYAMSVFGIFFKTVE